MDQSKENRKHPSYTKDTSRGGIISSKPAVKRLFSDTVQAQAAVLGNDEDQFRDEENEYEQEVEDEAPDSARKRQRSGQWPLPSTTEDDARSRAPLRSRPNAPQFPRRSSSVQPPRPHQRASSFVEGSMNDRVSVPPPANYVEPDGGSHQPDTEQQSRALDFVRTDSGSYIPRTEASTTAPSAQPTPTVKAETQKQSTVLRFGRNVASVFNVSNWKLFSKSTKDTKTGSTVESVYDIEASQKAYQDLKNSQKFEVHTTQSSRFPNPRKAARGSTKSPTRPRGRSEEPSNKRDSGVEVPSGQSTASLHDYPRPETPKKEKRYGRVYDSSPVRDQHDSQAPSPSSVSQSSHVSGNKTPMKRKSSFSFKKPFTTHHSTASEASLAGTAGSSKMPSKKQILHEQKLVKKISNLEFQLEEARRQLAESVGEPLPMMTTMASLDETLSQRPAIEFDDKPPRRVPRRQNFVPGALATLPSERLLSDYVEREESDEHESDRMPSNIVQTEAKVFQYFPELQGTNSFLPPSRSQSTVPEPRNLAVPNFLATNAMEGAALLAKREVSNSDLSSVNMSDATGDTVIHHVLGYERSQESLISGIENSQEDDTVRQTYDGRVRTHNTGWTPDPKLADSGDDGDHTDQETPKAKPVKEPIKVLKGPGNDGRGLVDVLKNESKGDLNAAKPRSADREGSDPLHAHHTPDTTHQGLTNTLEDGDMEDLSNSKHEPEERKVSGKRKSFGSKFDDSYSPKYSESDDDDAEWDEAAQYSTPRKTGSRQSLKKQKTSAQNSASSRKTGSFDSPKESFVNSTKYAKRISATPPRASLSGSPKDNFQKSPKLAKQTSPPKEAIRKGMNIFPPPPSSPGFNFAGDKYTRPATPAFNLSGDKYSRPATPVANKKQASPKRPVSPGVAAASVSKRSIQGSPMPASTQNKQDENAIPPVPKLSEEVLKKHRESVNPKKKKLTMEDVQRHRKTISNAGSSEDVQRHKKTKSNAGSTYHPDQDVVRKSIEKDGTSKSTKSGGVAKVKDEKRKKNEFEWDDDIF